MRATMTGYQNPFRRSRSPGTVALVVAVVALFILSWATQGRVAEPLVFTSDWSRPWGLFTYPFASGGSGGGLFWFMLLVYWFYWVGSSSESELGTPKFLGFFFALTALAALFIWAGSLVSGQRGLVVLAGLELPVAGLTVAWGTRHRHETIYLMFIIPILGWLLAWITVALVLFGFGRQMQSPLLGVFACIHLGLAYLFASNRLAPIPYVKGAQRRPEAPLKATERQDKSYYDDVRRREKEREERERLRKLFESSIDDEDK